jgi:hypothetical protein
MADVARIPVFRNVHAARTRHVIVRFKLAVERRSLVAALGGRLEHADGMVVIGSHERRDESSGERAHREMRGETRR